VAFIAPVGASGHRTAPTPLASGSSEAETAAVAGGLIAAAMHKWNATPGGPKATSSSGKPGAPVSAKRQSAE